MDNKQEKDECLERLWYMKEEGKKNISDLKNAMGQDYNDQIIDSLLAEQMIFFSEQGSCAALTPKGEDAARRLIRAHRIAERLVHDVLASSFESSACEFEHTVTQELVDGICTLLGHPRECPHGLPIPEGECCRRAARTAQSLVIPVAELAIGGSARVAYVYCKDDQQLHRINSLHIRPGAIVKLHQRYPSYVLECEGAHIALDEKVVANICVWKNTGNVDIHPQGLVSGRAQGKRPFGRGWGRGFGFGRNRGLQ